MRRGRPTPGGHLDEQRGVGRRSGRGAAAVTERARAERLVRRLLPRRYFEGWRGRLEHPRLRRGNGSRKGGCWRLVGRQGTAVLEVRGLACFGQVRPDAGSLTGEQLLVQRGDRDAIDRPRDARVHGKPELVLRLLLDRGRRLRGFGGRLEPGVGRAGRGEDARRLGGGDHLVERGDLLLVLRQVPVVVEPQLLERLRAGRRRQRLGYRQKAREPLHQIASGERLLEEPLGSVDLHRLSDESLAAEDPAHREARHTAPAQLSEQVVAADIGQQQVDECRVGPGTLDLCERLLPGVGEQGGEAMGVGDDGEQVGELHVVIDDE